MVSKEPPRHTAERIQIREQTQTTTEPTTDNKDTETTSRRVPRNS